MRWQHRARRFCMTNGNISSGIIAAPGVVSRRPFSSLKSIAFVEETRQRYAELFAQVARKFQLLKPETFQRVKRLVDGEEIDLDSAIEAFVDRRASNTMPEKVYRHARSVSAVSRPCFYWT